MPRGEIAEQWISGPRSGERFTFRIREGARPGKSERSVTDAINDLHARFDLVRAGFYPPGGGEVPLKDGENDHLIDALRYHFVNRPVGEKGPARRY